jgi:para-aminobenzoate synthetase component 1
MQIGIYDWVILVDHRNKTACLISHGFDAKTRANWGTLCALLEAPLLPHDAEPQMFKLNSAVQSNMDAATYAAAFNKIQYYIQEGDCYQVNLAQRFSAKASGDSWQAYQKLREISPAPFMAYMNFGAMQVLSGSPERFLQVQHGSVETRPIKGTRPRADDPVLDAQYAQDLQTSLKDRAENLMIVDLLRNDIGKNCETGSVRADKLFQLQSFANVHHLVSIVTGRLQAGKTALDLLRGCFPGGSITGAPKLRAMQIIEELEPHRRGVYCGAIGYIGFDGNMDTNIAIRTAVYLSHNNCGEISFYAGGGIVADSDLEKEYKETLDKASSMLKVMQYFSKGIS